MSLRHAFFALTAIASTAALTACSDDALPGPNADSACTGGAGDTVAITSAGNVVSFNRVPSATLGNNCTIKGLASGETLAAIDQRPANRTIYGLSSAGNLYVLNPANGQLGTKVALTVNTTTPINTACSPAVTQFTALSGTEFGVDFNPAVDRLRIVSDTGQNLRVNADNGQVTVDCPLLVGTAASKTSAAAYTNSVPGRGVQMTADPTSLFYIDTTTDQLLTTTAPNGGALTVVGPLGVDASAINGFDIVATVSGTTFTNSPYAVLTVGGKAGFYKIDTASGAATAVASFASTGALRGLTLK